MSKFEAIILAYHNDVQMQHSATYTPSAMQQIHGKPVLEWTIDALRGCHFIDQITVIGPGLLDEMVCMQYVERRLAPVSITFDKLFENNLSSTNNVSNQKAYLVLPCEAVLLTSDLLDQLYFHFTKDEHYIFFPVLSCTHPDLPLPPSITIDNKNLIPGYIVFVKKVETLPLAFKLLADTHPHNHIINNSGISISQLSSMLNHSKTDYMPVKYYECDNPAVGIALFTKESYSYITATLPSPFTTQLSKVKVIINPGSGRKKGMSKLYQSLPGIKFLLRKNTQSSDFYSAQIQNTLKGMGISAEIAESRSAKESTDIALKCAQDSYDLVIAAGGDGTINSVVNGLAGSQTTLGVIPLGTVNLTALGLNIPFDIEPACQIIKRGNIQKIDLGKINNKFFVDICGVGFDAYVIHQTNSALKKKLGFIAYILNGLKNIIRYPFHSIHISIDGNAFQSGSIVIIGNFKYYSASVLIADNAKPDDGLLDVVIFRKKDALSLLRYIWNLQRGSLILLPDVQYVQGKQIVIQKRGHHKIHIDGEYYGKTPAEITVAPSALKVVC